MQPGLSRSPPSLTRATAGFGVRKCPPPKSVPSATASPPPAAALPAAGGGWRGASRSHLPPHPPLVSMGTCRGWQKGAKRSVRCHRRRRGARGGLRGVLWEALAMPCPGVISAVALLVPHGVPPLFPSPRFTSWESGGVSAPGQASAFWLAAWPGCGPLVRPRGIWGHCGDRAPVQVSRNGRGGRFRASPSVWGSGTGLLSGGEEVVHALAPARLAK